MDALFNVIAGIGTLCDELYLKGQILGPGNPFIHSMPLKFLD